MKSIASVMARMHDYKIQHNCFYTKHIFVRFAGDEISIRIIDLGKAKVKVFRRHASFRDLYAFNRHAQGWSRSDRLRFFLLYLGQDRLDTAAKELWRRIVKRTILKAKNQVFGPWLFTA